MWTTGYNSSLPDLQRKSKEIWLICALDELQLENTWLIHKMCKYTHIVRKQIITDLAYIII